MSGLSRSVSPSDSRQRKNQESAGDSMHKARRLQQAAAMTSTMGDGSEGATGTGRDEFVAAMLGIAPQSVLDTSASVMDAISRSRTLLLTDSAAAIGCLLVYGMGEQDAIAFLVELDALESERFMVSLAQRTHAEVTQSVAKAGEAMLPSPVATSIDPPGRVRRASFDLETSVNDVAMGEISPLDIFHRASVAVTMARNRLASGVASQSSYSPLAPRRRLHLCPLHT